MFFPVAFTNIKFPNPNAVQAFIVKKMLTDHLNPGLLKVKKKAKFLLIYAKLA